MINLSDCRAWLESRNAMYRLLSRLYRCEADRPLLDSLKKTRLPIGCSDAGLCEGYDLIRLTLNGFTDETPDELAVDYAVTFLGAGTAKGTSMALPFASVYTSSKRILMQEARDRAVAAYSAKGLQTSPQLAGLPEDHLAILLDFMSFLCRSTKALAERDDFDEPGFKNALREQQAFLKQQLLNWVPLFCADVEKLAQTPFYRGVARLTGAYLRLDEQTVDNLINSEAAGETAAAV